MNGRYPRRSAIFTCVTLGCLALGIVSCASPNPNLYTLAPVSGPVLSGAPKVIELHQIAVARYLERDHIVRSSENYRLDVAGNDWWGEPLGAMLSRVLVEELSQRLPHSTVYASGGAVTATPDARVELDVQRMDLDANGTLVLIAQAAVSFKTRTSAAIRPFRFSIRPPGSGVSGQVAASSVAFGQLADGIAGMLARPAAK